MLLALPLALLLSSSPDARGSAGTLPEDAVARRTAPRLRASLGGALVFGYSEYRSAFGVGLSADVGAVFGDRLSVFLHAEGGTILFAVITSGAAVVEYAFNDHFSAGVGAGLALWARLAYGLDVGQFLGLTFPLRVNYAPVARAGNQTAHRGLLLGLQVAPGFSLLPTYYPQLQNPLPPSPGFTASLTVSTAWW